MRKINFILFFSIFLSLVFIQSASAIRCNGRIVTLGDTKFEVLATCGEPAWIEKRTIKHIERRNHRIYSDKYPHREYSSYPSVVVIPIEVEEWLYNFGSHRFLQILRFENGDLVEIENGDYGF